MRCLRIAQMYCLLCLSVSLFGQITPNAPVQDFRFPRFGENGYTQWVLQGQQGIYDSEAQIRVEGMALRVYSGDERMAQELSLASPQATLRLQENRAFSEDAIEIVGANFTINGVGWEWSGETKEIVVKTDTVVRFTQGIASAFSEVSDAETEQTEIRSESLILRTTEEAYYFEFTGQVEVISEQMHLSSEQLIVFADPPKGRTEDSEASGREPVVPSTAPTELDSIRHLIAQGNVVIVQAGKVVNAQEAEFFPRENRAILTGQASVAAPGAYLSGQSIHSQTGEIVISGTPESGRAQMILSDAGGLGLQGSAALSSQTIVLANSITMREQAEENHFLFEGAVEVMSGALQMTATNMTIVSAPREATQLPVETAETGALDVGEVKQILAQGNVVIEQSGQFATGEQVIFYPAEERAVLTGNPRVTNGEAVVTGQSMELKPGQATVRGELSDPVVVRLPQMPDLGYDFSAGSTEAPAGDLPVKLEDPIKPVETIVTSRLLRMIEQTDHTLFRFSDDVQVKATNLQASSDRLDVIAREDSSPVAAAEMPLRLERIEAHENVVIQQTGRTSTAKLAIILPDEGKLVLEGDAVVNDDRGRVSGHRMTLLQGQRRAIVEGAGSGDGRARITLPALPVRD
ncbi:MAG: hypothetical protein EA353_02480 [Puniceicoccaceae bacterium]|nr:MAG: hypothetical protein EA353_02480 [Puniceicoccaceae bacterium]